MRTLSLFAGIGGFDLGLEATGHFETVAFCEIDPYCRAVLAKHWPGVPCYEDVRTLTVDQLGSIDAICGGFPCQDLSVAGKRAGIEGTRSGLYVEIMRLAAGLRPRLILLENVPGIRSRGVGAVFRDLAALGYHAFWDCVPASALGACHQRDRWFCIAWLPADAIGNVKPWEKPCRRPVGRVGRIEQPVAWDTDWQTALSIFRGLDDGLPRSVASTDAYRNAICPPWAEAVGWAAVEILQGLEK